MVGAYRDLKAIRGKAGLFGGGEIDSSIAHEGIKTTSSSVEVCNELTDRFQRGKIQVHDGVRVLGHAEAFGCEFGFAEITASHDDVPFASSSESLSSVKSKTGGGTGNDYGRLLRGLVSSGDCGRSSGGSGNSTDNSGGHAGVTRFAGGSGSALSVESSGARDGGKAKSSLGSSSTMDVLGHTGRGHYASHCLLIRLALVS